VRDAMDPDERRRYTRAVRCASSSRSSGWTR
jgi:hypothetical protein